MHFTTEKGDKDMIGYTLLYLAAFYNNDNTLEIII